jgi:hypothetical protein
MEAGSFERIHFAKNFFNSILQLINFWCFSSFLLLNLTQNSLTQFPTHFVVFLNQLLVILLPSSRFYHPTPFFYFPLPTPSLQPIQTSFDSAKGCERGIFV